MSRPTDEQIASWKTDIEYECVDPMMLLDLLVEQRERADKAETVHLEMFSMWNESSEWAAWFAAKSHWLADRIVEDAQKCINGDCVGARHAESRLAAVREMIPWLAATVPDGRLDDLIRALDGVS